MTPEQPKLTEAQIVALVLTYSDRRGSAIAYQVDPSVWCSLDDIGFTMDGITTEAGDAYLDTLVRNARHAAIEAVLEATTPQTSTDIPMWQRLSTPGARVTPLAGRVLAGEIGTIDQASKDGGIVWVVFQHQRTSYRTGKPKHGECELSLIADAPRKRVLKPGSSLELIADAPPAEQGEPAKPASEAERLLVETMMLLDSNQPLAGWVAVRIAKTLRAMRNRPHAPEPASVQDVEKLITNHRLRTGDLAIAALAEDIAKQDEIWETIREIEEALLHAFRTERAGVHAIQEHASQMEAERQAAIARAERAEAQLRSATSYIRDLKGELGLVRERAEKAEAELKEVKHDG